MDNALAMAILLLMLGTGACHALADQLRDQKHYWEAHLVRMFQYVMLACLLLIVLNTPSPSP